MATYFDAFLGAVQQCPDPGGVLGEDYLVLPPSECWAPYWCEPRNAVTFAQMGVDGVHYAILKINGEVRDDSPVIHISPMDFDEPYCVLGVSFLDYLADACNVSKREMSDVFEEERSGKRTLVPFLKKHFDHSRLYEEERLRRLDCYLKLVEIREEVDRRPPDHR